MLDLGNLIDRISVKDPYSAIVLQKIADGVNNLAINSANNPSGFATPPPRLEGINVKAASGLVHIVLTHNAPIQKGIQYLTEADTNPAFPQPHVIDHGASRSAFVTLPAKNDGGDAQSWYFRSYAQYPGSKPTTPIVLGGSTTPTPVSVGGSTQLTPLASTGSGTASNNGQQGGQGLGVNLFRSKS
jgi:hypothetical protein